MALVPVTCPYCHSAQVIKGGKTETGKQRYRCQPTDCSHRSFVLDPAYNGRLPQIKEPVLDLALNGRGIRDTARVLKISPTTVINELQRASGGDSALARYTEMPGVVIMGLWENHREQ